MQRFRLVVLATWVLAAGIACQGLKTRDSARPRNAPQAPKDRGGSLAPTAQPKNGSIDGDFESRSTDPIAPTDTSEDNGDERTDSDSNAVPAAKTFLGRSQPKVGLILGPGGLKAYAHVGVLKQFEKSRIPIHAVTGLEWGALVAALYADKASANDADWRLNRLREADLPKRNWPLGSTQIQRDQYRDYFKTAALDQLSINRFKVPFGCPVATNSPQLGQRVAAIIESGPAVNAVERCLAMAPLFASDANESAGATSLLEAAKWLRSKGADLVVFVNVLGSGDVLSAELVKAEPGTRDLWNEVRRAVVGSARSPVANWVLDVPTQGHALDSFDGRRATQSAGERSAGKLTEKLAKQYGF